MQLIRTLRRSSVLSLLASLVFGFLTACGGSDARIDEQLRADLAAAAQAPGARGQFASPAELGYGQGYAPNYSPGAQAYGPQPYPPQYGYPGYPPGAYPQAPQRVVYAPASAPVRRSGGAGRVGARGTAGTVARPAERRNTQKGAVIGAATGAVIGVATSRDRVKGGAIGALGGAVLGGVIGHQIKTPRN